MAETIRIDLEEFDRWAADRFTVQAATLVPALVGSGQLTEEQGEVETRELLEVATLLNEQPPHRGAWIAIKKVLNHGDVSDAKSAALKRDDSGRMYHDEAAYQIALMAAAVTAWSLADDNGTAWPIGRDGIRRLDEVMATWLWERIDEQRGTYLRSREQMVALKSRVGGGVDTE